MLLTIDDVEADTMNDSWYSLYHLECIELFGA